MRKTSQDGADTSSITSAIENEVKKTSGLKTKRTSIKRKIPNFSHDSDDTVIEPLLQAEKQKSDNSKSAKFLMSKSKTDSGSERSENVFIESKIDCSPTSTTPISDTTSYTSKGKEALPKVTAPIHNHMNTNVFGGIDTTKSLPTKTAVIVEIENSKGSTYNPSPLIFTTAKIHTDNKTKQMEPVQVTPVPILSTIEGSVIKSVPGVNDRKESLNEQAKSKTEIQRKDGKEIENKQKISEPTTTTKDGFRSVISTSDSQASLKPTVSSYKDKSVDKALTATAAAKVPQNVLDKPRVVQVDTSVKTSTSISLKSDIKLSQPVISLGSTVDKSKSTLPEKSIGDYSSFRSGQESKIGNGKTALSGDTKKLASNGVSHKPDLSLSKESAVSTTTLAETKSKDKQTKTISAASSNKQLQRQKKATVEDITETDVKIKNIDHGQMNKSNEQKDQINKINTSVKSVSESKPQGKITTKDTAAATVSCISIPTASTKPSSEKLEKVSPASSMQTPTNNIATSAKTSTTASTVISDKDQKSTIKGAGDTSKSVNINKSVKKEPIAAVKKGTESKVTASSSKPETTKSVAKAPQVSKSDVQVTQQLSESNKTTVPSAGPSNTGSIPTGKSVTSRTVKTNASKSADTTTISSSPSSAKTLTTTNKKIEPLFSEHNKDSRA